MKYIGTKEKDREYTLRRAVFGLIFNQFNEIAIIKIDNFGYNLPGGKVEKNENTEETLIREMVEETGYSIKDINYYDTLGSYYYLKLKNGDCYCESIADFYTAQIGELKQPKIEEYHHLIWAKPRDVYNKMYFDYHKYVIKDYLSKKKINGGR